MRRIASLLVLLLAAAVAPAPAQAEGEAYVSVSYSLQSVRLNGQEYVVAICEATSSPNMTDDLPTQTGVICSVNGVDVYSFGAGWKAYAAATHPFPRPVTFCHEGLALFFDDRVFTYAVRSGRECIVY